MFSINCIKREVSVCDGVLVCLWLCGRIYLWTQINPETSVPVQHWTHNAICDNMWWSSSFHVSVLMWIPVKRPQWRNNRNCCALEPSSDVFNMWYSYSLSFSVWIQIPVNWMQRRNNINCSGFEVLRKLSSVCCLLSLSVLVCGCGSLWTE